MSNEMCMEHLDYDLHSLKVGDLIGFESLEPDFDKWITDDRKKNLPYVKAKVTDIWDDGYGFFAEVTVEKDGVEAIEEMSLDFEMNGITNIFNLGEKE